MSKRRVVITGMGVITPLGCSVREYWDGLISGRSGIATIRRFDPTGFDTHFAGECRDFSPERWIELKAARRM